MTRPIAITCVLALCALGLIVTTASASASDPRITKKYGYVEFSSYGETLKAVDTFGDGRAVRAYLHWGRTGSAQVTDAGFDPNPAEKNLSIAEGTVVSLTMCYTKNDHIVNCSDPVRGVA